MLDVIRPKILFDADIASWYRQNLLLYVKRTQLDKLKIDEPPFIPDEFELVLTEILEQPLNLKPLLRALPDAVARAIKFRLSKYVGRFNS